MKKILILLFLSQTIYAQKTYKFDYILEYKNKIDSTKLISNPTYYVNSKANNYSILVFKRDSLNIGLYFGDKNGTKQPRVNSDVNESAFNYTKSISVTCEALSYSGEYHYKYKVKEYYFENLKDTIIDKIPYYHYVIKSNKPLKYQKRKNIAQSHFIVDKNSTSFLPFFYHPIVYEEWKTDVKIVPNGIIKIKYNTNWENKITDKWVLEKITPIEKELIIPEDCDLY
jgi:hypothetical protein